MRSAVVDNIKSAVLSGLSVAQELPYDESGTPLYVKNPKRIYVDRETTEITPLILVLNGVNISNETTSVSVFFTTDAKNPPPNYETNLSTIKGLINTIDFDGANNRNAIVNQRYEDDLLVTQVEFRFTRIA
jgi:hypothetical protein